MPKILALDTSTDACSVALYLNGEFREDFRIIPRQHTKQLLPMVEQMLSDVGIVVADLDAIAFGRGPGSFAGIRIATGAAQGLAYAAELPLLPISTLQALALTAFEAEGADTSVAALDARMDEIYVASYRIVEGLPVEVSPEQVCAPGDLVLDQTLSNTFAVGSGWRYLSDMSPQVQECIRVSEQDYYPSAQAMLKLALRDWELGKAVSPEQALPVYLRDEVAWKKKDQQ